MVFYELKKIIVKPGSKIAIALLIVIVALMCYLQTCEKSSEICWINENGRFEIGFSSTRRLREAQKVWSGPLDEEKLQMALLFLKQNNTSHKRQGAGQIRALLNRSYQENLKYTADDYYNAERIEPSQLTQFYKNREKLMYQWLYGEASNGGSNLYTEAEKRFLMEQIKTIKTPFQLDYVMGWEQASKAAVGISTVGIIILGFLLTGVFADEFRWNADTVFFSTLYARKKAVKAKIVVAFLVTSVLYWSAIIVSGLFLFNYFSIDGANCPIQTLSEYWFSIYHLTFMQRYMLTILSNYIGWLFTASTIMMFTAICKSSIVPVIVPILLNIIPMWALGDANFLPKLLTLFPSSLFTLFTDMDNTTVYTIGNTVTTAGPIIIPMYILLTLLFTVISYFTFRHTQID